MLFLIPSHLKMIPSKRFLYCKTFEQHFFLIVPERQFLWGLLNCNLSRDLNCVQYNNCITLYMLSGTYIRPWCFSATAEKFKIIFFIITNSNLPVNGVLKSIKYDLDNCNYGNVQCALKIQFFQYQSGSVFWIFGHAYWSVNNKTLATGDTF